MITIYLMENAGVRKARTIASEGKDELFMTSQKFLEILQQAAKLKVTPRHCYTEKDRAESVADHSWRIALMAMLLSGEEEFREVDMNKVIRMCLIHDLGESFTGDIPTFDKTDDDTRNEDALFLEWVNGFPEPQRKEWQALLAEMERLETKEAKTYKALDKLEALISHNESDISTWIPLEYELQLTYGQENVQFSEYLRAFRQTIDAWTRKKIEEEV
ncbi:HD domain protein [Marvinbryantia formatexigens DSM 14469]|uniref:5'-deoxynucleotidase n=1 Tax=Marvinbryantia formatexigens DSM 14469 TaxID=478749 RepID=C6LB40_9FIRM|nr:HD domain-containing protein [Marvinbryantia formatexigens]EET62171.1 HD domain protein [Marvinbryantia formatexigens DSM 14469]